jgi:polar amino acid transport system substrate-binding protein
VATEWQRRLQRLTISPYDSPAAALDALAAAEVDAVLVDAISARLYPAVGTSLRLLPEPVTVEPFALVVRKDDEVLLEKLNESLAALADSGQLDRIVDKWFQPAPDNE